MKKKNNQNTEDKPDSIDQSVGGGEKSKAKKIKSSANLHDGLAADSREESEASADGIKTSMLSKSEYKAKLNEAKSTLSYSRKLLKKAKKVFKSTSRKKDPSLYEIIKFNFSEAKRRKKEQKMQVRNLKKMKSDFMFHGNGQIQS